MNDTYDFTAEVEAEENEARRKAIEGIKNLYEWRQTEKAVDAQLKAIDPSASDYGKMGDLRRWLIDHDEPLFDDEHGLKAWLQGMGETEVYDTPLAIRERDLQLFQRLLELDCLRVDATRVKDAIKNNLLMAGDIGTFKHGVLRTAALKVEKVAS